jgi:hypothetical protein
MALQIWKAYPRKLGRKQALAAIERVLKTKRIEGKELLERVKFFAETVADSAPQFIPYGSTFFRSERWNDEELLGEMAKAGDRGRVMRLPAVFAEAARTDPRVAEEDAALQAWAQTVPIGVIWELRGKLAERSATLGALLKG